MDNCINRLIPGRLLVTFILVTSPADAVEPSAGKKLVVSPSASDAASAIQPNAEIRNGSSIPSLTDTSPMKKAIPLPSGTPGAAQSLNSQPLPLGGAIKQIPGAILQPPDTAKSRIDIEIKASPKFIQPEVSPGAITGATANVTSSSVTIRIEGNGRCALNVIDMHNGSQGPAPIWPRRIDAPPSYFGPLPARIEVQAKVVNRDFVQIVGAGGPDGCSGYASVRLY